MTTYYVRKTGNDANNGTSPGTAWATIGKALGGAGATGGDTVYVGPGIYREQVTVSATGTAGNILTVVADYDGSHTTDAAGEVRWTGYDVSDTSLPTGANPTLTLNGKSYLTFQSFLFQAGKNAAFGCVSGNTGGSQNITFTDCTFLVGSSSTPPLIGYTGTASAAANWLIDRCRFFGYGSSMLAFSLSLPTANTTDYNINFTIQNCLMVGLGISATTTGALTNKPGGVTILNCTMLFARGSCISTGTNMSITIPCNVDNSIICGSTGLNATTSGQIVEDFNYIAAQTTRTNVTAGVHSISDNSYAFLVHMGQELPWGRYCRPFATPTAASPLLGFGSTNSPPSVDILNRPRPSGGNSASYAVGCAELHDFGAKESSIIDAGTASIKLAGPGDQFIYIAVDAVSTTITIKCYRDANYGAGTKPQVVLVANNEIGVSTQTVTDAGSASTWNTLTLAAFTPSGKGVVTLQLVSNSAVNGNCYFDTVTVS